MGTLGKQWKWTKKQKQNHKGSFGKHWKLSEESKQKACNNGFKKGEKKSPFSDEHKRKMSEARKGKTPWNYKGGISSENVKIRTSPEYKKWRLEVFKRDWYRCFDCGKTSPQLEADHIYSFANYPRLRMVLENGITLCALCHKIKTKLERTDKCILATQ